MQGNKADRHEAAGEEGKMDNGIMKQDLGKGAEVSNE
jgi:hypothetical protein